MPKKFVIYCSGNASRVVLFFRNVENRTKYIPQTIVYDGSNEDVVQFFKIIFSREIDTFYSPRKFFGIPDGAYLYTNKRLDTEFEQDFSYQRCENLLGRLDVNAEKFYHTFKENDDLLCYQPIKKMSKLTLRILQSIDYKNIAEIRYNNFLYLHKRLDPFNQLKIRLDKKFVPMVYPYLIKDGKSLIENLKNKKVYVAIYWPNISKWCKPEMFEYYLMNNLVPLPIDKRYMINDIKKIIELIENFKWKK